jgi:hypothetical protein
MLKRSELCSRIGIGELNPARIRASENLGAKDYPRLRHIELPPGKTRNSQILAHDYTHEGPNIWAFLALQSFLYVSGKYESAKAIGFEGRYAGSERIREDQGDAVEISGI